MGLGGGGLTSISWLGVLFFLLLCLFGELGDLLAHGAFFLLVDVFFLFEGAPAVGSLSLVDVDALLLADALDVIEQLGVDVLCNGSNSGLLVGVGGLAEEPAEEGRLAQAALTDHHDAGALEGQLAEGESFALVLFNRGVVEGWGSVGVGEVAAVAFCVEGVGGWGGGVRIV